MPGIRKEEGRGKHHQKKQAFTRGTDRRGIRTLKAKAIDKAKHHDPRRGKGGTREESTKAADPSAAEADKVHGKGVNPTRERGGPA